MMRNQHQKLLILLLLVFLASILPCQASAPAVSASAYVLMDAESGRVLLEKAGEKELPIASTTKIMTALVALEQGALTDVVRVKKEHLKEGSSMYLREGEELTLEWLLYGLMLSSGNDAAQCIADSYGGDAFIEKMNEKAAALGMTHTAFANASGLDEEGHYSCALDMARLAAYAMRNPVFARITATKSASVGERHLSNHNKLLSSMQGCIGLKTGYTSSAGRTLVTCCERNGLRLVAVTLHDGNDWADHTALYEYAFAQYSANAAVRQCDVCAHLPIEGAVEKSMAVTAQHSIYYPCTREESFSYEKRLPSCVTAPVKAGDAVGELIVRCNGVEIGRTALLCARDIEKEEKKTAENLFSRMLRAFSADDQR